MKVSIGINKKHNVKKAKNCVCISGGGTRGIFAIGLLEYLFEPNDYIMLNNVDIFGGTSVGSYLATALSIGYNRDDIVNLSKTINLNNLLDGGSFYIPASYHFLRYQYIYGDTGRLAIVKNILNYKLAQINKDLNDNLTIESITIAHLKKLIEKYPSTYKHLIVNAVDLNRQEQIFITTLDDNCNNISLINAMLASSAIPYIFNATVLYNVPNTNIYLPVEADNTTVNYLYDGGTSTNNPLDYFLLDYDTYRNYNLWLVEFSKEPTYTQINGVISMLMILLDFLIFGKNDTKLELLQNEFNVNIINLHTTAGTFTIYSQSQIQSIIEDIYNKCKTGQIDVTQI